MYDDNLKPHMNTHVEMSHILYVMASYPSSELTDLKIKMTALGVQNDKLHIASIQELSLLPHI